MLHSAVYNTAFTEDMQQAVIFRDADFFTKEIIRLCSEVSDPTVAPSSDEIIKSKYETHLTRLLISLALLDSLQRKGETIQFCCDFINF